MGKQWAAKEFSSINFGDLRLDRRFQKVSQKMFERPTASINEACFTWADTKGAYRLFDNEKVSSEEILAAHREQILRRIKKEKVVYAIQDTTFFNYHPHRARTDMGIIESKSRPLRGLIAHNVLMLSEDEVPLGIFHQKIYARLPKENRSKWYLKDLKDKESYRWLEAVEVLSQNLPRSTKCVVIADREADIHDLYQACLEKGFDFVIRAYRNRTVGEKSKRWEDKEDTYLFEHIEKQKVESKITLEVYDSKLNKDRVAHLNMRFCKISCPAPWRMDWSIKRQIPNLEMFVVELKEHHHPQGAAPIHWRILTSLPIFTEKEALKVVRIYKKRWNIETYHKVLKSGCRVEECRLAKRDNLKKFLTLCSVIAWRLFWITKIGRRDPDRPCDQTFLAEEWRAIYRFTNKTRKLPPRIPTTREILRSMAQIGGFLGRKTDGEPGIITVWRGWSHLNSFLQMNTYG
jgi:hypothetical protein